MIEVPGKNDLNQSSMPVDPEESAISVDSMPMREKVAGLYCMVSG